MLSALVVGLISALVFYVWYPLPLFELQGVGTVLALLVVVDVIVGPTLTLIIAGAAKQRRELFRDLTVIGGVQLIALSFGIYSLFIARPAFIVFNSDRFDVVAANDLARDPSLQYRDLQFQSASILGPEWVSARPPDSIDARNQLLFSALQGGADLMHYPALYESWPRDSALNPTKLKRLTDLSAVSEEANRATLKAMRLSGLKEGELAYLPLVGRKKTGVVILNRKTLAVVLASNATPNY